MKKHVLDVGNCDMDHAAIRSLLESRYQAQVARAHDWDDVQRQMQSQEFDLVLINRILDRDGTHGLELIRRIKTHEQWGSTPVMMITNFAEHQQLAIEAGAEPGFGKRELLNTETEARLARHL